MKGWHWGALWVMWLVLGVSVMRWGPMYTVPWFLMWLGMGAAFRRWHSRSATTRLKPQ